MTASWQERFQPHDKSRGENSSPLPSALMREDQVEDGPDLDMSQYRPWVIQRGRSGPAMMIDFRTYEPRSGLWSGVAMSYPHLVSLRYTGPTMLSLNFGMSQIVIEGKGLDDLARHVQQGTVTAVQQYAETIWPRKPSARMVSAIHLIDGSDA